jgi:hypothetical protein
MLEGSTVNGRHCVVSGTRTRTGRGRDEETDSTEKMSDSRCSEYCCIPFYRKIFLDEPFPSGINASPVGPVETLVLYRLYEGPGQDEITCCYAGCHCHKRFMTLKLTHQDWDSQTYVYRLQQLMTFGTTIIPEHYQHDIMALSIRSSSRLMSFSSAYVPNS